MYQIKPLSSVMGIEIIGLNLLSVIRDAQIQELKNLIYQHKVVVFRNQNMGHLEQILICARFGEIEPHPLKLNSCIYKEMTIVSNINPDGSFNKKPGPPFLLWHSDGCYLKKPPIFSFFYAEQAPNQGGNTLFINAAKAYDELDNQIKNTLQYKKAVFDYAENMMQRCQDKGFQYFISEEDRRRGAIHPVFRAHPVTGEKSIFVNSTHSDCIVKLEKAESEQYLECIFSHVEQEKYIYNHKYKNGDLMVWDNSSTIHSGDYLVPCDSPRIMRRVMVR